MAESLPTLSVVVPNFNHAQYLPRCLNALLSQSVPPLEILVIDDASTDDSVQIAEAYERRHANVRLIRNETNQGVVVNLNRGLEYAGGERVYFASADDMVLPGFIEKSLSLLADHPQAVLSCAVGDWREPATGLNPHIGATMGARPCFLSPDDLVRLEYQGRLQIASNTVIYKSEALRTAGGFRSELGWHTDWFAIYTLAFRFGVCFVPEPLAVFFLHPTAYSAKTPGKEAARQQVYRRILESLSREEFGDVMPRLRDSGALFEFEWPMLKLIRACPEFHQFLTPAFVRKARWQGLKMAVKRYTPAWVGEVYYRLSGRRAATAPPAAVQ